MLQVVIIADEVDAISVEVRAASDAFEIVVTAGGVGPTRDDVTMAGVAEALGKPLLRSASALASLCSQQHAPLILLTEGQGSKAFFFSSLCLPDSCCNAMENQCFMATSSPFDTCAVPWIDNRAQ